jgi:hypothetical protein
MKRFALSLLLVVACVDETNLGNTRTVSFDPKVRWAASFNPINPGDSRTAFIRDMATDSVGDVVLVMDTCCEGPITSFIAKRAAKDGSERWTLHLTVEGPSGSNIDILGVAIGADDSIIVTGGYGGTVDFGGQFLSTEGTVSDTFIATYSASGALLWVRGLSTKAVSSGDSIEVADNGDIYLIGTYGTSITLAGHYYPSPPHDPAPAPYNRYSFILALDANGVERWARTFSAPIGDVALANDGDILLTGSLLGPASVGGTTLIPIDDGDVFISRYRPDGVFVDSRVLGRANEQTCGQAMVQPDGSIVMRVFGPLDSAPDTLVALDDSLNEIWTAHTDYTAFTFDSYSTVGAAMPIPKQGSLPTGFDVARVEVDGSETIVSLGTAIAGSQRGSGVFLASSRDGVYAFGGEHNGTFDFGTGPITGDGDLLVVLVDPTSPTIVTAN